MGHFGGPTWAFTRRTRSSPGYHLWDLQPWQGNGLHSVGLRRGDSEPRAEGKGQIIPESRCSFVLQDADGEWVMRQECA